MTTIKKNTKKTATIKKTKTDTVILSSDKSESEKDAIKSPECLNIPFKKVLPILKEYYADIMTSDDSSEGRVDTDLNAYFKTIWDLTMSNPKEYIAAFDENNKKIDLAAIPPAEAIKLCHVAINPYFEYINQNFEQLVEHLKKDKYFQKEYTWKLFHPILIPVANSSDVRKKAIKVSSATINPIDFNNTRHIVSTIGFTKIENIIDNLISFNTDSAEDAAVVNSTICMSYLSSLDFLNIVTMIRSVLKVFLLA